jgi:hypothetical protein
VTIAAPIRRRPSCTSAISPKTREQALAIADWLRQHGGLRIELARGRGRAVEAAAAAKATTSRCACCGYGLPPPGERLAEQGVDAVVPLARAVLLRVDPTLEPPQAGYGADRLLDLPDLRTTTQAERTSAFLRQLHDWLSDAAPPEPPEPPPGDASSEVDRLLAELQIPQTLPPRRLAIGDRLAEIGDPRPGVGVREYVVRPAEAEPNCSRKSPSRRRSRRAASQSAIASPRSATRVAASGSIRAACPRSTGSRSRAASSSIRTANGARCRASPWRVTRSPTPSTRRSSTLAATAAPRQACGKRSSPLAGRRLVAGSQAARTGDRGWLQANRPRTNVDWYEAVAFSRWLSKQLGYEVRLPTELEWERAARGRDGREYPWGKALRIGSREHQRDLGNDRVGEWHLGQTTAVGVYRHGASSEGVLDLSGNVWEWCLNKYDRTREQIQADTSGQARVLRGGSWDITADGARGARRFRLYPV